MTKIPASEHYRITLNGYGQMYRSGITMKEHWATEKRIEQDRKQMEKDRLGKSLK